MPPPLCHKPADFESDAVRHSGGMSAMLEIRAFLAVAFLEKQIFRIARNAVRKDRHQRRSERKVSHRAGSKACVRPATDWIYREENNLTVIETTQLHDGVIAR